MDVLLVSPSPTGAPALAARAFVGRLAAALASEGHTVRWLRPRTVREPAPVGSGGGVQLLDVPTRIPSFRSVSEQLTDLPTERALVAELRVRPPDLLHVHGFGGAASYMVPWLGDRLGVATVVVATPFAQVVCHRGTLVRARGEACDVWSDGRRCASCCRVASPHGLGPVSAALAALLRPIGGLSPFPAAYQFENRLDMIVQGLAAARVVCVDGDDAGRALEALGVPRRSIRAGVPEPTAAAWMSIHRAARSPGG